MKVVHTTGYALMVVMSLVLWLSFSGGTAADPSPPEQPDDGPGGASYEYDSVLYDAHDGQNPFWIIRGRQNSSGPLVVFVPGWTAYTPHVYRHWMEHLARRGNIVLFVEYQPYVWSLPHKFTDNAVGSVQAGIEHLTASQLEPDLDRVAFLGHSAGGAIATNLASVASEVDQVPRPHALMVTHPARMFKVFDWGNVKRVFPMKPLSGMPEDFHLVVTFTDTDRIVRPNTALRIYSEAPLPEENKNFILVRSDSHGSPPLKANHFSPLSPGRIDGHQTLSSWLQKRIGQQGLSSLDYYGYWKFFDGLTDYTFYGTNREYALGNGEAVKNMGTWSDGTPVKPALAGEEAVEVLTGE